jgi:hypothetical protein
MSFSFDTGLVSPKDQVRQNIGDTVNGLGATACDFQDETINFYLSTGLTVVGCSAKLCRDAAAKYAKLVTISADQQSSEFSKIYDNYVALALRFEADAEGEAIIPPSGGSPSLGGVSVGGVMVTGANRTGWSPRDIFWPCGNRY